ncbi:MAG: sensor domain-containing diguanylate cyclase [Desulfarculus sp.]|nr:sensor domain-containing diguanylate cyclase [Desulfarculus sp.]
MAIDDHHPRVKSLLAKQQALANLTLEMTRQVELHVQPIFETALQQAGQALEAGMACLHLADEQHGLTRLVANWNLTPAWTQKWGSLSLAEDSAPALCQKSGQALELGPEQAPPGLGGLATAPVRGMDLTVGTVSVLYAGPPPLDPDRASFLESVGHLLGLAIEHSGLVSELMDNLDQLMQLKSSLEARNQELDQANRQLAELSVTDGLTGVYNHRHLHERLAREIARSRRLGHPICLVMADLDHFKQVNDRLGHQVGDEALRLTAGWLKAGVREVDLVGRYGGEEFMLVLVDCHLQAGRQVADKLRQTIAQRSRRQPFDALGGFTVSMGVAQLVPGMDEQELIAAADQALYRAKTGGRDRVETA